MFFGAASRTFAFLNVYFYNVFTVDWYFINLDLVLSGVMSVIS